LAKLEREHSQLIMDLNRELGLDLTTNLVMGKKALLGSAFPEYDLDKLIKDLNENSFDVLSKQKNLEFNELELHITKREYIQTPKGSVDTMEDNIVVYKDELEKQKISSEVKVRNDYLNLQNLEDSLRIAELSLQLSEKNYSTTKVRYELGLVTSLDFVKAGDDVRAKKEAIESAKLDLYKAVVNFEHDNKL